MVTGERKEDNMEKESFLVLRNVIRAVIRWQLTRVFIDCHAERGVVPPPADKINPLHRKHKNTSDYVFNGDNVRVKHVPSGHNYSITGNNLR